MHERVEFAEDRARMMEVNLQGQLSTLKPSNTSEELLPPLVMQERLEFAEERARMVEANPQEQLSTHMTFVQVHQPANISGELLAPLVMQERVKSAEERARMVEANLREQLSMHRSALEAERQGRQRAEQELQKAQDLFHHSSCRAREQLISLQHQVRMAASSWNMHSNHPARISAQHFIRPLTSLAGKHTVCATYAHEALVHMKYALKSLPTILPKHPTPLKQQFQGKSASDRTSAVVALAVYILFACMKADLKFAMPKASSAPDCKYGGSDCSSERIHHGLSEGQSCDAIFSDRLWSFSVRHAKSCFPRHCQQLCFFGNKLVLSAARQLRARFAITFPTPSSLLELFFDQAGSFITQEDLCRAGSYEARFANMLCHAVNLSKCHALESPPTAFLPGLPNAHLQ